AHVDLRGRLRGGWRARRARLGVPPAAGALRPQHVLAVGARAGLRPHGARGRRAGFTAAVLRQLPGADHLPRAVPRAELLDRDADRRLHRTGGWLAHAVAAPEALRLTARLTRCGPGRPVADGWRILFAEGLLLVAGEHGGLEQLLSDQRGHEGGKDDHRYQL